MAGACGAVRTAKGAFRLSCFPSCHFIIILNVYVFFVNRFDLTPRILPLNYFYVNLEYIFKF